MAGEAGWGEEGADDAKEWAWDVDEGGGVASVFEEGFGDFEDADGASASEGVGGADGFWGGGDVYECGDVGFDSEWVFHGVPAIGEDGAAVFQEVGSEALEGGGAAFWAVDEAGTNDGVGDCFLLGEEGFGAAFGGGVDVGGEVGGGDGGLEDEVGAGGFGGGFEEVAGGGDVGFVEGFTVFGEDGFR